MAEEAVVVAAAQQFAQQETLEPTLTALRQLMAEEAVVVVQPAEVELLAAEAEAAEPQAVVQSSQEVSLAEAEASQAK
jgi:hypothetical protein